MTERVWDRLDPVAEALVEESRARQASSLSGRERLAAWAIGLAFLAVAAPLAITAPTERAPGAWLAVLLVAAYGLASRIEFEIGSGFAVPTQLVLVPMLLVLPAGAVPIAVALGYTCARLDLYLGGRERPERVVMLLGSSWFAVGPAAVFLAAGEPGAELRNWPVLAGAVAAQFAVDLASSVGREWLAAGVPPRLVLGPLGWVFMVDALLAPIGLLAAIGMDETRGAFVLALPLLVLLAVFARERQARIGHALELSGAYRRTALLLGDVVEADDSYTGSHSRHVVDLVLAVADELQLSPADRRDAEFAALLHDVGKIRIPGEIIGKPGPLTPAERRVMETHTVEGQRLLERVGGALGDVGPIVRSCHEHYDGGGYPDGLAGAEIPLVARIVCACDALSAMTTDRPYRAAMPLADALDELRRNAGGQFDPRVVLALEAVLSRAPTAAWKTGGSGLPTS